jgi:TolB protein
MTLLAATVASLLVSFGGTITAGGKPLAKGTQAVWSPDGSQIAFVRNGELHVARADGRRDRRLTVRKPGLHWPASWPSWSPDGTRIAFSGTRDVFTVRLADRKLMNLTHSRESWRANFTPAYSPDGKLIAFSRSTDAFNSDIFVMRATGGGLRRVTKSRGTDSTLGEEHGPTWSPDGRTIVFVSNRTVTSWELFSIGVDGHNEQQLTDTPRVDEDAPRFSRDGTRILYVHGRRIAAMNADGTGVRELGRGSFADWR